MISRLLPVCCILCAFIMSSVTVGAQIYKTVDKDGNVIFTDQPQDGAEEIKLKPLPVVPSIPTNTPSSSAVQQTSPSADNFQYQQIDVLLPDADETSSVRSNNGSVTVIANLTPRLIPTHKLQLLIDGAVQGNARPSNVFTLTNIDRGDHQLQIEILDGQGQIIQRSPVKLMSMQRSSVNQPGRRR